MSTKVYCKRVTDIPTGPHYAILNSNSQYIPGDERSRTHPGHGYPAYTEYYMDYISFTDYNEWVEEVNRLTKQSKSQTPTFVAVQVTPAVVETTVKVTITPSQAHIYTKRCPKCGRIATGLLRDTFATRICACGNRWKPAEDYQGSEMPEQ